MDRQSESVKELVERLAAVTAAVGYVQLDGKVEFGRTRYKYATQAALLMAVREHLAQHEVAITAHVHSVERIETKTVKYDKEDISNDWLCHVDYTMRYGDQWICTTCPGFGQGDKGLYSAQTNAMKYWLRNTFLIATGEDAEEYDNQRAAQQQPVSRETPPPQKPAKADPRTEKCDRAAKILVELGAIPSHDAAMSAVKRAAAGLARRDGLDPSGVTVQHIEEATAALAEEMNG